MRNLQRMSMMNVKENVCMGQKPNFAFFQCCVGSGGGQGDGGGGGTVAPASSTYAGGSGGTGLSSDPDLFGGVIFKDSALYVMYTSQRSPFSLHTLQSLLVCCTVRGHDDFRQNLCIPQDGGYGGGGGGGAGFATIGGTLRITFTSTDS